MERKRTKSKWFNISLFIQFMLKLCQIYFGPKTVKNISKQYFPNFISLHMHSLRTTLYLNFSIIAIWHKNINDKKKKMSINVFFLKMCHMYGWYKPWWSSAISALLTFLSSTMHRWLAYAKLYLPVLHGTRGCSSFTYLWK